MLGLVFLFLVMFVVMAVVLGVGTVWLQGYFYSQPVDNILWRAPAAALVLTLLFAGWSYLEAKNPERYVTIFEFSPRQDFTYDEIWTVKGSDKALYKKRKNLQGHIAYLDSDQKPPTTHPDLVIVKEDGQDVQFKPDRDAKGNFKIERGQSLEYRDDKGRVMAETQLGQVSITRTGWLFTNMLVNSVHFVAWFLVTWLILRFQWSHALGLAVFFWLTLTLTMMPMLLSRAREGTGAKPAPKTSHAASAMVWA